MDRIDVGATVPLFTVTRINVFERPKCVSFIDYHIIFFTYPIYIFYFDTSTFSELLSEMGQSGLP